MIIINRRTRYQWRRNSTPMMLPILPSLLNSEKMVLVVRLIVYLKYTLSARLAAMHTPLIMRLPEGFDRRGEVKDMVQNIDFAPTFLELAGVRVPEEMHGISLVPLLKGEKLDRKSLFYHFYEYPAEHMVMRHFGVRTERYKLIRFYGDGEFYELYDLENDPAELHNLYGKPEYENLADSLKVELARLREEYGDTEGTM